jgi:hypothetical protein
VEKEELNIQTYEINVYFKEDDSSTVGELRICMPEILGQIEERLDYFFIAGVGEKTLVPIYNGYAKGKFNFPERVKNNMKIMDGRFFDGEEIENGENVILGENIGTVGMFYTLFDKEFEIIGITEKSFENENKEIIIPYLGCPDEVQILQMIWNFKGLPTQKDYLTIKNAMTEVFGDRISVDEFEVKDVEALITINSVMTYSIIVSIVIALDTCLLYGYLFYKRRKQTAIYALTGAKRHTIVFINLFEIMMISTTTLSIGLVLFKTLLERIVLDMFDKAIDIYTPVIYVQLSGVYIGMIFGFTLILTVLYSRSGVVERLRR